MNKALRDSWTDYAKEQGLIGEVSMPTGLGKPAQPLPLKYGNKRIDIDGITFDSKREAGRYQELKWRLKAGEIADLELQPVYPLHIMQLWRPGEIQITTVGILTLDFRYVELKLANRGEIVVEDVKSEATKTTAYVLRKKIAEAVHGIVITEVA